MPTILKLAAKVDLSFTQVPNNYEPSSFIRGPQLNLSKERNNLIYLDLDIHEIIKQGNSTESLNKDYSSSQNKTEILGDMNNTPKKYTMQQVYSRTAHDYHSLTTIVLCIFVFLGCVILVFHTI